MFCFKSIQRLQKSSCEIAGPSEVRDFVTFLCISYSSSVIMNFLLTDPKTLLVTLLAHVFLEIAGCQAAIVGYFLNDNGYSFPDTYDFMSLSSHVPGLSAMTRYSICFKKTARMSS